MDVVMMGGPADGQTVTVGDPPPRTLCWAATEPLELLGVVPSLSAAPEVVTYYLGTWREPGNADEYRYEYGPDWARRIYGSAR